MWHRRTLNHPMFNFQAILRSMIFTRLLLGYAPWFAKEQTFMPISAFGLTLRLLQTKQRRNAMVGESDKFDTVVRRLLSVSHEEIQKRDAEWRRKRARKKRAKTSPASRASGSKA